MSSIVWITPAGPLFSAYEGNTVLESIRTNSEYTNYTLISGSLPPGLRLSTSVLGGLGLITGVPEPTLNVSRYEFVVRARTNTGVSDRTFSIDILGPDQPGWVTSTGGNQYLNINGKDYVFTGEWVDFQLKANPTEAPSTAKIRYYIPDKGGILPAGLTLTTDGKITGFVKDSVSVDGQISPTGGYDTESYDKYTFDHSPTTFGKIPGVPRIYQFVVAATDGVLENRKVFKIVVTSADILNYNVSSMPVDIVLPAISSPNIYMQPLQWINGSDLGTIRANNNQDIPVTVYDASPNAGTLKYRLINTGTVETNLPLGLRLDPDKGYLSGYIPYQPAYTKNYSLSIEATKTDIATQTKTTSTNTFTLAVKGEVESTIQWITPENLGQIFVGHISELSVKAKHINSDYSIKYTLESGALPPGLVLARDGSISGRSAYGTDAEYNFTVKASDVYDLSAITRTFTVRTNGLSSPEYTNISLRPFLSQDKRDQYREFVNNTFTFDPNLIYRYYDFNFGVQRSIQLVVEFGIEKLTLGEYVDALKKNFYKKRFYFGDIKTAIAKDDFGAPLYEIVYLDMIDDQAGANSVIYVDNDLYYPGSIENMQKSLRALQLPDGSAISVDDSYQPLFMQTPQAGEYRIPGYMTVVPICYALPGQGSRIVSRIKLSGFDFKLLDFEIDRIIIQGTQDSATTKYLLLQRQNIGDAISSDPYLEEDIVWTFDDNVTLTRK